jgi:hypothetical protein
MLGCRSLTPHVSCTIQFEQPEYDDVQNHECWVFCKTHRCLHQAAALAGPGRPHWLEIEKYRNGEITAFERLRHEL